MRAKTFDIKRRVLETVNSQWGIINYDVDNSYPQRVRALINDSPRAIHVRSILHRFIKGDGFKDKVYWQTVINRKGETLDALVRSNTEDISYFNGFAIHINYNANYKIVELNFIPFEHVRLPHEQNAEKQGKVCLYDDWVRWKRYVIKEERLDWIDEFNPDPVVIQAQVDEAGGWQFYKGQVLYVKCECASSYPLSPFDPALEDVDTNAQLKQFNNNLVRKEFNPSVILYTRTRSEADGANEEKTNSTDQEIKKFMGAENNAKFMHWEGDTPEDKPEFIEVPQNEMDKKYLNLKDDVRENIRSAGKVPIILMGDHTPGKLGQTQQEIIDATEYYNWVTLDYRRKVEETHTMLSRYMVNPSNPTNDYSLIPATIINTENQSLIQVLQVGGTQAFVQVLESTLLPAQKINTLVIVFGIPEENAQAIVNGTPLPQQAKP